MHSSVIYLPAAITDKNRRIKIYFYFRLLHLIAYILQLFSNVFLTLGLGPRIPLTGPFVAACVGIFVSDTYPDSWLVFAGLFFLFCLVALVWRKTLFTLAATILFFAFYPQFLIAHDQGFQLSLMTELNLPVHRCILCAQSDSTPFRWANQPNQQFHAAIREFDSF